MGINSSCQTDWCVKPAQMYCDCSQKAFCYKCFTTHMSLNTPHRASAISQSSIPLIYTKLRYLKSDKTTEVFEGIHKSTEVIIKVQFFTTKSELNRKQEEAALQRSTKHKNICKCIKSFIDEEFPEGFKFVILMEKAEKDLDEEIQHRSNNGLKWTEDEIFYHLSCLVDALEFMQSNAMAHRDIKPGNILIFYSEMKLADFGLSIQEQDLDCSLLKVVGTFMYLSPKLMQAYKDIETGKNISGCVDHNPYKSDVYSLGLTFLYMSSLSPPNGLNFNISGTTYLHHKLRREINLLNYSEDLKFVFSLMLEVEEDSRPDFTELKKILNRSSRVSKSIGISEIPQMETEISPFSFGISEIPAAESVSEPPASITIEQILNDTYLPGSIKAALNSAISDKKLIISHPLYINEAEYIKILTTEQNLLTLDLTDCSLTHKSLEIILSGNLSSLTALVLGSNKLGRKGAKILGRGLIKCTELKILRVWNNRFGNKGVGYCCRGIGDTIQELFLGENKIGDEGAALVAKSASKNLQILSLCDGEISDEGARVLAVGFSGHMNIRQVYLDRNRICAIGLKYLVCYLPKSLKTLRLAGNEISEEMVAKLHLGYKILV